MISRILKNIKSSVALSLLIVSTVVSLTGCGEQSPVSVAAEVVVVKNAYIRAMPPGQKVTAMFMTLDNTSASNHRLVKAESDVSAAVELHEHKQVNGMMKMGQVKFIDLKGNGTTALAPSGYHVMLIGLKADLKLGEKVAMKLTYEDGSSQQIEPEVKTITTH